MPLRLLIASAIAALASLSAAQSIELKLPQFESVKAEGSALEVAGEGGHTPEHWFGAWWVALDEPPVEDAIVLIGAGPRGWEIRPVPAAVPSAMQGRTTDIEAFARKGDYVYLLGSHFGKKLGPLGADRQFVGRFLDPLEPTPEATGPLEIELINTDFRLHRLINDALVQYQVPLLPRGERETQMYIQATSHPQVKPEDRAINIEGAVFLENGNLLVGLRFPTTQRGQAILLEMAGIEDLFSGGFPTVSRLFVLNTPSPMPCPVGIRALERRGSEIHAIIGTLDRRNDRDRSAVIDDHPKGMEAPCAHVAFAMPPEGALGVTSRLVRAFPNVYDVEGLSFRPDGKAIYLHDDTNVKLTLPGD